LSIGKFKSPSANYDYTVIQIDVKYSALHPEFSRYIRRDLFQDFLLKKHRYSRYSPLKPGGFPPETLGGFPGGFTSEHRSLSRSTCQGHAPTFCTPCNWLA